MSQQCYCILLRTAARKVTSVYDAALAPAGINVAQYSLLRRIERAAPVSQTELARMAELDRSTVGRNVRLLERAGLVRVAPGEDQREATASLSERGRSVVAEAEPLWDRAQQQVEASLGPANAQLRTLLTNL